MPSPALILPGVFLSTPSARRATTASYSFSGRSRFLSTPSARRATKPPPPGHDRLHISIHALREEGDAIRVIMP